MLRNYLLSALAAATLAGCATDYAYRGGNGGDYYYGQPRTDYRYYDPYGYSGAYGGYYYDRFGRPLYGYPYGYGGYFGGAYYGYPYWYRQRPHRHEGDHGTQPPAQGEAGHDRKPPWRDLDGLVPRSPRVVEEDGEETRPRRRMTAPFATPGPRQREQPMMAAPMPRMRSEMPGAGGSRMGRVIRNAKAPDSADE